MGILPGCPRLPDSRADTIRKQNTYVRRGKSAGLLFHLETDWTVAIGKYHEFFTVSYPRKRNSEVCIRFGAALQYSTSTRENMACKQRRQ